MPGQYVQLGPEIQEREMQGPITNRGKVIGYHIMVRQDEHAPRKASGQRGSARPGKQPLEAPPGKITRHVQGW